MHSNKIASFKHGLHGLLLTIGAISLVFENSKYELITEAVNHLRTNIPEDAALIAQTIQKVQHTKNLLNHLADIHYCAGCNYLAERFANMATAFIEDMQPGQDDHSASQNQ